MRRCLCVFHERRCRIIDREASSISRHLLSSNITACRPPPALRPVEGILDMLRIPRGAGRMALVNISPDRPPGRLPDVDRLPKHIQKNIDYRPALVQAGEFEQGIVLAVLGEIFRIGTTMDRGRRLQIPTALVPEGQAAPKFRDGLARGHVRLVLPFQEEAAQNLRRRRIDRLGRHRLLGRSAFSHPMRQSIISLCQNTKIRCGLRNQIINGPLLRPPINADVDRHDALPIPAIFYSGLFQPQLQVGRQLTTAPAPPAPPAAHREIARWGGSAVRRVGDAASRRAPAA